MPFGQGSRTQLRSIVESAFGVTPNSGNPNNIRRVSDNLDYKISSQISDEIRADRQTSDSILVGASAQGGLQFELSYKEYDALLEAVLQGTWSAYGTAGAGATFTSTVTLSNTMTASVAPTGGSAFTNLAKGQWVKILGGANAGKFAQVSKTTSPTTTVIVFEGTGLTNETSAAGVSLNTSRLTNGTTQRSFTLERAHADIAQFVAFRGMTVGKMSLDLKSGAKVTGSFEFMGKDQLVQGSTTLPGSPVASQTYDVMNAVTGVGDIQEAGAALASTYMKSLTLQLDNKLRGRDAIGVLGNADIGSGSIELTGNFSIYFANATMYAKFLAQTRTSISFRVVDAAGNGYVFQLPSVKLSEGTIEGGSKETDCMVNFGYTALMDPSTGQMFFVDRVGA